MSDTLRKLGGRFAAFGRALMLAGLALASGAGLAQALNDIPMAVKNNVSPNFMFMLDNSGSMSNIVPTLPYVANTDYSPGGCTGSNILGNGTQIDLRVSSGVPAIRIRVSNIDYDYQHWTSATTGSSRRCFARTTTYNARLLADNSGSPSGYLNAEYDGNYLNWYFGNAGNATNFPLTGWGTRKRLVNNAVGTAVETRMEIAKRSATSVISGLNYSDTSPSLRVGLSAYNGGDGGALRVAIGDLNTAKRTSMLNSISALTPSGSTPLAETLADIGRYMATGYSGDVSYSYNTLVGATTTTTTVSVPIGDFLLQGRPSCLNGANCEITTTDPVADGAGGRPAFSVGTPTRPVQLWCQRSYAFLMTDGRPQMDQAFINNTHLRDYDRDCATNTAAAASSCVGGTPASAISNWDRKTTRGYEPQGSDYLDDVAKALFDVDLRPNLPSPTQRTPAKKNNLITYVIGFADKQVLNDPLLVNTALQGGSRNALFPTDASQLTSAFNSVIADALSSDAAAAAVAVANAQITLGNTGYASSYRSGSWYGDLVAYSLNTTTALQTGSDLWSLRTSLQSQAPASRKIATYNGSAGVAFASGLSYAGQPSSLTNPVIDYVRGNRSGEIGMPGGTYRTRSDVLGDIINAEPVVVTYGTVPIIFQGANDGMLHVVDGRTDAAATTRGQELWAYVPRLVHANLAALADPDYDHKYYVDGTPAVADLSATSKLLVGGLGKGGKGYYALNISSYTAATQADVASKVLWEFSPTGMGYSFGTPLIVKVGTNWRVVVPSGYDATVHGIWVLDPATGTGSFITAPSASGLAHLGKLANVAADANTRYVWGGDNVGNVFRFDLVSLTAVRIAALTDAGGSLAQPVTAPPEVGTVPGSTTKFLVHVGTGRYLADGDVPGTGANAEATQRQTIYGLVDDTSVAAPTLPNLRGSNGANCPTNGGNGDLVCQALTYVTGTDTYQATTNAVDLNTKRGWYLDLPTSSTPASNNMINGRMVSKPALTSSGVLTLTVNIPTNVQCDPGGRSWFLALNSTTGGAVPRIVGGNTYYDAGYFLGYALASRPVIVTTADGKRALIRMSDKTVQAPNVPEPASTAAQWRRIYWRAVK